MGHLFGSFGSYEGKQLSPEATAFYLLTYPLLHRQAELQEMLCEFAGSLLSISSTMTDAEEGKPRAPAQGSLPHFPGDPAGAWRLGPSGMGCG